MNVFLPVFAGLGDKAFSAGTERLDKIMDSLAPEWDAIHYWHWQWETAAGDIVSRHRRGDKVIMIGHSMGVYSETNVAYKLQNAGIKVDLLCAIDPTAGRHMVVSQNVLRTNEFWSEPGMFGKIFNAPYRARKDPSGVRGGRLAYMKAWKGFAREPIKVPGGHVACASAKITIETILADVKEVLKA